MISLHVFPLQKLASVTFTLVSKAVTINKYFDHVIGHMGIIISGLLQC